MIGQMLDRLVGQYAARKYAAVDAAYTPEMAITSTHLVNEGASRLTVLFPPWRGGEAAYDLLTKRLANNGSAVLRYAFHGQILESKVERVLESFAYIQQNVTEDLEQLHARGAYEQTSLVASSLGNVSLALVARSFPSFHSATLVVPGSNLAKCVWQGSRTGSIRGAFMQQGIDESALSTAWAEIAPSAAAGSFVGKQLQVIISSSDGVIPSRYQHEMATEIAAQVTDAQIVRTRVGHIANVARYCLIGALPGAYNA